jgi:hypothetical protein
MPARPAPCAWLCDPALPRLHGRHVRCTARHACMYALDVGDSTHGENAPRSYQAVQRFWRAAVAGAVGLSDLHPAAAADGSGTPLQTEEHWVAQASALPTSSMLPASSRKGHAIGPSSTRTPVGSEIGGLKLVEARSMQLAQGEDDSGGAWETWSSSGSDLADGDRCGHTDAAHHTTTKARGRRREDRHTYKVRRWVGCCGSDEGWQLA